MNLTNITGEIGSTFDKVKPFLTAIPDALKAIAGNQEFPARTLLVTLIVTLVLCWVSVKLLAGSLKPKKLQARRRPGISPLSTGRTPADPTPKGRS